MVPEVPLGRYLLLVGSALIALLFLADSYLPKFSGPFERESKVDKTIIRITSAHRWPQKVVYDTSQPTIVPPSVVAENAPTPIPKTEEVPTPRASASVRQAFAMATVAPVPERALVHPKRKAKRKSPGARLLAYREPSNSWPAGW